MTVDYTQRNISCINAIQVLNDSDEWVHLLDFQDVKISYPESNVPSCVITGASNTLITEGRQIRAVVASGSIGTSYIQSGQTDPIVDSGTLFQSGQTQKRLTVDPDNGLVVWFSGYIKTIDTRQLSTLGVITITAVSYLFKLLEESIEDPGGYHYGSYVDLDYTSGTVIYDYDAISEDCKDVYKIEIGSDVNNLTEVREGTVWTNDYPANRIIFFSELPVGIIIRVHFHLEIDPKILFDSMCAEVGIPAAFYSGTSFAGSPISRVWFPQGWSYLQCLNNVADQKSATVYTDHSGIVRFDPRPLDTDSAAATFKDGQESDYQLISGININDLETKPENISVTGATWYQYSREGADGLIADFNDGSNINQFGGLIEVVKDGTADLTPDENVFYPSYERSDRVGKLTGIIYNGTAGIKLYLKTDKTGLDISGFDGVQSWIRGNGKNMMLEIEDSSGNKSSYNLSRVDSYSSKIQIDLDDISGSADTSDIASITIMQTDQGLVDFSIDNVAMYPNNNGSNITRVRREQTLSAKYGSLNSNSKAIAYRCLSDINEIQAIAAARYARKEADLQRLNVTIGGAIDPNMDLNKIIYVVSGDIDQKYEVLSLDIAMKPNNEVVFSIGVLTPLASNHKPITLLSSGIVFALLSATADVSDSEVIETYNDDVDEITGQSLWNHNIIAPNDMTLISASADVSDSEIKALFSKYPESVESSNINNYEVHNISHGDDVSIVADVSDSSITATFDQTPGSANLSATDVNNYEALNIKPEIVSMVADVSLGTVVITFKEPLNEVDAKNINNYYLLNIKETA